MSPTVRPAWSQWPQRGRDAWRRCGWTTTPWQNWFPTQLRAATWRLPAQMVTTVTITTLGFPILVPSARITHVGLHVKFLLLLTYPNQRLNVKTTWSNLPISNFMKIRSDDLEFLKGSDGLKHRQAGTQICATKSRIFANLHKECA
jgi:hypothetical protein